MRPSAWGHKLTGDFRLFLTKSVGALPVVEERRSMSIGVTLSTASK